jgi:hypothetical protein
MSTPNSYQNNYYNPYTPPNPRGVQNGDDKVAKAQKQLDEIVPVMQQNIQLVIDRGAKIEETAEKADELAKRSDDFQKGAARVKRHFCLQHAKMVALICVVLLVIALILWGVFK